MDAHLFVAYLKVRVMASTREEQASGISLLPDELLLLIFENVALHGHGRSLEALRLLHVSRRWYGVILRSPSLWTDIVLSAYSCGTSLALVRASLEKRQASYCGIDR